MNYRVTPKKKFKITTVLYWVVFVAIAMFAVIPIVTTTNLPFPYKFFAVETGSMKPVLKPGDLIVVSTKNSEYRVGDIITFKFKGDTNTINNTHRIIDVKTNTDGSKEYITKGDFNNVIDVDPVIEDRIVGEYIFKIPLLGYPIQFVQTVPGLILLIVIPSTILIYEEINSIKKELRKKKLTRTENKYQK